MGETTIGADAAIDAAATGIAATVARMKAAAATSQGADVATAPQGEAEKLDPVEYVTVPVGNLKAALLCASNEETRYYLCGVHVVAEGASVRVVATDGHRLFVADHDRSMHATRDKPASWLDQGLIIPRETLKAKLAIIEGEFDKKQEAVVQIGYARGDSCVTLRDPLGACTFRLPPVDGAFPEYKRAMANAEASLSARAMTEGEASTFDPKIMKTATEVAAVLKGGAISLFHSGKECPAVVTFSEAPAAAMILMPCRIDAPLRQETMAILSPAMRGHRAAIQANLTRTLPKLAECKDKDEKAKLAAKVADYQQRLKAIDAACNPADLDAPAPQIEAEAEAPVTPPVKPAKAAKGKAAASVH